MKFESKRDVTFSIFISGTIAVLVGTSTIGFISIEPLPVWVHILNLVGIVFLLWIFYDTNYDLANGFLKYKSGPFRGSIDINSIKEIIKDKTSWVGLKPATATKGLIIKYDKFYDEIYISPKSNELFIKEIIKLNPGIKITQG